MTHLAPHPGPLETDVEVLFQQAHQRRRRRRMVLAVALVVTVGAAAAGVALAGGDGSAQHSAKATAPLRPSTTKFGPPPLVAWVDYQRQVHIGSLRTHQQRVIASNGFDPTTPLVASGNSIFWTAPSALGSDVMAYDIASGRVRSFVPGTQVFNAVGSSDVFVDDGNNSTIARYRLDGSLVKRLALPHGWFLASADLLGNPGAALAHNRILVRSQPSIPTQTSNSEPAKLAVWTPSTGDIHPLGDVWKVIATYTDSGNARSLIAWLPANCWSTDTCMVQLTDLAAGTTKRIPNPLGYGFDFGGAFSPDGRQLAVFAKTNSGYTDPETRLALIDVTTGDLRPVPGATIGIGESVGWAQWLPDSRQVIAGGTSGNDGRGTWRANHFLVDSSTLRSTPISFLHDGLQDVNYSAVVLP